jgi:hypothetical protein
MHIWEWIGNKLFPIPRIVSSLFRRDVVDAIKRASPKYLLFSWCGVFVFS